MTYLKEKNLRRGHDVIKSSILEFFQILFLMKRQYPLPSYPKPAPRPIIRKVEKDQSPSAEMRKWLLEGHNKNIVF